ncbi:MAG: PAS domain S-box protein [Chloroflexaceae bacterium]|nr:PAS domain S-box protein [Chloroflexaceae bacterium]
MIHKHLYEADTMSQYSEANSNYEHEIDLLQLKHFRLQYEIDQLQQERDRLADELQSLQYEQEHITFQSRILDSIEQSVIVTNIDGTITYINHAAEKMYGWPLAEALGQSIFDIVTVYGMEKAQKAMEDLQHGHTWTGEILLQDRSGRPFSAFVVDVPMFDEHGDVCGFIGISTDITEKTRTEKQLRENQQFIEYVTSVIPDLIYVYDLTEQCNVYVNREVTTILGYSTEHIQALKDQIFTHLLPSG